LLDMPVADGFGVVYATGCDVVADGGSGHAGRALDWSANTKVCLP